MLPSALCLIGLPSRRQISGQIVAECIKTGKVLEDLPIEVYKSYSDEIGEDVYDAVNLDNCLCRRTSAGGPAIESVKTQIEYVRSRASRE